MKKITMTLDHLAEYLRAGWAKAVASPHATAQQKVSGSLKGTFLIYLEDHGPDALLDYATDYNERLTALRDHSATPVSVRSDLGRLIVVTEVVIDHLRNLR